MLKSLRSKGSVILFTTACMATAATAQQHTKQAQRIPGPVKDAGVYHVATGTWTRHASDTLAFGPKTLYNNTANTGYFGLHNANEIWYGTARIPGTGDASLPNAKSDAYVVDGGQIAYCNSEGPAGVAIDIEWYESLASCIDPTTGTTLNSFVLSGLPGSSAVGVTACWIVTVDLAGTSLTCATAADGDGVYDGILDLDSGGASFQFVSTAGGYAGPLLNGDPRNFPYGDGTYYQASGASTATGLGIQDQFYLIDTTGILANGCYWFGGYAAGNPFSAWWVVLFGDNGDEACSRVCQSNPSSAGAGAQIELAGTSGSSWTFAAEPVPNQPGIFFHAPNSIRVPFGFGFLCAGGGIVRLLPPVIAVGNRAEKTVDTSGLAGIRYFQYWYRDPASGPPAFNTSDAICCEF